MPLEVGLLFVCFCVGLLFVCFCIYAYRHITQDYGKWKQLGIPHITPSFPFGTFGDWVLRRKNISDMLKEQSRLFSSCKVWGAFRMGKPVLVVNDPEIAKFILVKDFPNFIERQDKQTRRGWKGGEYDKVFGSQLTMLEGNKWKDVRSTFSPIFTSGKLKIMTEFIKEITSNLVNAMSRKHGEEIDLLKVFELFSMDSIASCAFGIDAQSFENMESNFTRHARIFNNMSTTDIFKLLALRIPGISRLNEILKFNVHKPTQIKFFVDIIRSSIQHRRKNNTTRNDMIDLFIEAMNEEGINVQEDENKDDQFEKDAKLNHSQRIKKFDEDTLFATAMFFITAGAETTGVTLGFASYYLTICPDIQKKLQNEIDEAYRKADGEMPSYSAIQSLQLLDKVLHEALRLHPPVAGITRVSDRKYDIPGTDITIMPDDMVLINAVGIHYDEKYYPNPTQFNPENFSKVAKRNRSPYSFLSFSQGPRNCIGMRFALLEAKMALMAVLRNFDIEKCNKTCETPILDPTSSIGCPKGGLWARVMKRTR